MKKSVHLIACTIAFLGFYSCKNKAPDPELVTIDLLRGDVLLCGPGNFGEVSFSESCSIKTQENFDLGIALLHSFEYEEAEKAFVKVIDEDPDCVMAYWGVAMSNFHSLWLQSGTGYLEKGSKIVEIAQKLPKTEREQDYLDAIGVFYKDWKTIDRKTRISLFEQKMEALYQKYDDDKEAAIFYALALCSAADPTDKTYTNQLRAGKILESLLKDNPNHPGIAHYIIHNYDYPELAKLALPVARRYAKIAPASAHAQHMPSHIFTRLGLWNESINSNLNSTSAAVCYAESTHPKAHWDEELHGMDYLVYAYLQTGDHAKANEQNEYLKTFKEVFPANFKIAYSVAAIPARIALEDKDWKKAADLQLPSLDIDWKDFPWERSVFHFARALGSARSEDISAVEKELDSLKIAHQELLYLKDDYKARQVLIQINAIAAWILYAEGNHNKAIAQMTETADMEDSTAKHPVTPGEVVPARELLGDLLLACNKPVEALEAYEADLAMRPNRFNGLYGAAITAKLAGKPDKAEHYFTKLLEIAKSSNSDRPEIKEAIAYLEKEITTVKQD